MPRKVVAKSLPRPAAAVALRAHIWCKEGSKEQCFAALAGEQYWSSGLYW